MRPESPDEWQVVRAVAARRRDRKDDDDDESERDEIDRKLGAWRDYRARKDRMRREVGLTVRARYPFAWNDRSDAEDGDGKNEPSMGPPEVARAEFDREAARVLRRLASRTNDANIRERIERGVDLLEDEIEGATSTTGEVGGEVGEGMGRSKEDVAVGPIDVGDVFRSDPTIDEIDADEGHDDGSVSEAAAVEAEDPIRGDALAARRSVDENDAVDDDVSTMASLGSMEEQTFRSLVARSKVRTREGRADLRNQWEEYRRAESAMRERVGLSAPASTEDATTPDDEAPHVARDAATTTSDPPPPTLGFSEGPRREGTRHSCVTRRTGDEPPRPKPSKDGEEEPQAKRIPGKRKFGEGMMASRR